MNKGGSADHRFGERQQKSVRIFVSPPVKLKLYELSNGQLIKYRGIIIS